ncbi:MAG TPA: lysozyme family protein [Pseudogracilibacillus sp.]|nr:lysozyme family protein [Pseudogracilibacillus sp.]
MRKSKLYIRSLFKLITVVTLIVLVLVGVSYYAWKNELRQEMSYHFNVHHVEKHRSLVEKHAKDAGLEAEIETLLAIMMQESGGRGEDPMQASESLCGEVGCIKEPEESIEQGVAYYKQTLEAAKGDRKLAVQSYNFGVGFIDYALTHEGKYTPEIAIKFSQEMYNRAEDQSIYTCKRKEAKEYDACYGDILYVRNVLGYRDIFIANAKRELASTQK